MLRLLGGLAVEPDVAGPAQQPGAGDDHRGVAGVLGVERADEVGVEQLGGPLDVQRLGGAVHPLHVARVRRRQRAQQADAGVDHQRRGGHPGQQRDLGVPLLDREHPAEAQRPPLAVDVDLLLGQRQRHSPAGGLPLLAQLADLAEQHEELVGRPGVDLLLDAGVVELRPAADDRADHVDGGALALGVDLDRPEQRRPVLVGQQGGRALRQRPWGAAGSWSRRRRASRRAGWPPRRPGRPGSRRRRRRRSRSARGTRPRRARCAAPGRGPSTSRGRSSRRGCRCGRGREAAATGPPPAPRARRRAGTPGARRGPAGWR